MPGVGKTRFANGFIKQAITYAAQDERWQVYRAATANPLDDWQGEEIMLLDDLRASAMDVNDWLLLLDPHNVSRSHAPAIRIKAKSPRLIVITATIIEPSSFFSMPGRRGMWMKLSTSSSAACSRS